eukprot:6285892-Pyramimonas_sp.AAC.1
MVELPKEYRFEYPAEGWKSVTVSRNDSNAYGTDAHLSHQLGDIIVNILPFGRDTRGSTAGVTSIPDVYTIAQFLQRASMGPHLSLMDAELVKAEDKSVAGDKYFYYECAPSRPPIDPL